MSGCRSEAGCCVDTRSAVAMVDRMYDVNRIKQQDNGTHYKMLGHKPTRAAPKAPRPGVMIVEVGVRSPPRLYVLQRMKTWEHADSNLTALRRYNESSAMPP